MRSPSTPTPQTKLIFLRGVKRVIFGTYHFVRKVYLERYIDEAVFRFNTKEMKEADRFSIMFEKSIGKVLYEDVKIVA